MQILIKNYLFVKCPYEDKYQLLINKCKGLGFLIILKLLLNDMGNIYENIEKYKPNIELKILIAFDISSDIISNKKLNPTVTEFFIRGIKLNISLVFFYTILFCCTKKY